MNTTRNDQAISGSDLLALLAKALNCLEPVPTNAREQAYSARHMSAIDASLALLVFDSHLSSQPIMRRGQESEARFLSFTNENLRLELSLLADGRTIVGDIDPAVAREVEVEEEDGHSVTAVADEYGRFRVTSEAVSFRLRVTGHLVTQWIRR